MKVKTIALDGIKYFGTIKGSVITGTTICDYSSYLKKKALGELITVTIGDDKNLVITDLSKKEVIECKRINSLWKLAEDQTIAHTTCQIFDTMMGSFGKKL